jgi:hypothetical protein
MRSMETCTRESAFGVEVSRERIAAAAKPA